MFLRMFTYKRNKMNNLMFKKHNLRFDYMSFLFLENVVKYLFDQKLHNINKININKDV